MKLSQRSCFAIVFGGIFQLISIVLVVQTMVNFYQALAIDKSEFTAAIIASINMLIIALAMFELGLGISKEYLVDDRSFSFYSNIRRTITRFVGTVCIALVLEALIMIIKYSQLELAGNLWYPVGIILGGSVLLIALGLFLYLTSASSHEEAVKAGDVDPKYACR